jgi:hypothetical protein
MCDRRAKLCWTRPIQIVIAGLDPAIHPFERLLFGLMDARVKPAHDESAFACLPPAPAYTRIGIST